MNLAIKRVTGLVVKNRMTKKESGAQGCKRRTQFNASLAESKKIMKAYFKKSSDLERQSSDERSQNQAIRSGQIQRDKTQVPETSISSQSEASAEQRACSSEDQDVELEIRNTVVSANNSSALT